MNSQTQAYEAKMITAGREKDGKWKEESVVSIENGVRGYLAAHEFIEVNASVTTPADLAHKAEVKNAMAKKESGRNPEGITL